MADASPLTTDRVLARRYRLVRLLAQGDVTQVWEGHDTVLDRPVAVKVLDPHLSDDAATASRFRREAVAAARLAHPHVVSTFDTGSEDGMPFIVMELLAGRTLRQVLDDEGALDPRRAVRIALAVAEALEHAHRRGLVHGDVRPGTVVCTDDGRVKVADFGIAGSAEGGDATGPGADPSGDLHALGGVLYEMLCGRPPFAPAPLRPRQLRAGIPRALEDAVLRALAANPADRFTSAAELRGALLAVDLGDDDATAMVVRDPTPPGGITPSFAQSERSWLVPTAVIVLVAAALVTAGLVFARTDVGRDLIRSTREALGGSASGEAATVTGAEAFDPQGNGGENDGALPLLFDGDPQTAWTTEGYNNRALGGLKDGVGVVLRLDATRPLGHLKVTSPTRGWAAEVYVSRQAHPTLAGWGRPVAAQEGIDGSATFDLKATEGSVVLVWITDLGDAPPRVRATIAEVELTA